MIKILTLLLIPYFSFSQMQKKMGDDPPPCPYPTFGDVVNCGNSTNSSIIFAGAECNGDFVVQDTYNGRVEIYNNGNIICRDASMEPCIFIVATDGTISMRNTTATNAEVEMKYAGTTTTTAVFTYRQQIDTVAYVTDIPRIIGIAPVFTNDSTAGAGGLTSGKIYKSLVGTDYVLKIKQ